MLLFDADTAGAEAALRGVRLAEREGLSVRVAVLPAGLDPADAAIEQPDALAAAVEGAPSVLAYRVRNQLDSGRPRRPLPAATRAFAALREMLAEAPPSIERAELVQQVAGRLRLPSDLTAELAPRRVQRRVARDALPQRRRGARSGRRSTSGACSRSRPWSPDARARASSVSGPRRSRSPSTRRPPVRCSRAPREPLQMPPMPQRSRTSSPS